MTWFSEIDLIQWLEEIDVFQRLQNDLRHGDLFQSTPYKESSLHDDMYRESVMLCTICNRCHPQIMISIFDAFLNS